MKQTKKLLAVLLVLCMIFTLSCTALAVEGDASMAGKTVILHSNDVHGNLEGYALMAGAGGILVTVLARSIINIFPILMGLLLMINGIGNLSQSFSNSGASITEKILPALVALAGLLILIHPSTIVNSVVIVAGVTLIVNGLSDLSLIRRFW